MGVEVSSISDTGLKRQVNQDSILVYRREAKQFFLFAVADGMGGYADGEKASSAITGGLRTWLDAMMDTGLFPGPTAFFSGLGEKLSEVSRYIHTELNREQICGSTCVVLFFHEDMYGTFSVGDSRIYAARAWKNELLTKDDVWENLPEVQSRYSPAERRCNPNYGKLTRAIGSSEKLAYSMNTGRLAEGDAFALCSDGIYKMCSEAFLGRMLRKARHGALDDVRDGIKKEVFRRGAEDNLSLILVRWNQKP